MERLGRIARDGYDKSRRLSDCASIVSYRNRCHWKGHRLSLRPWSAADPATGLHPFQVDIGRMTGGFQRVISPYIQEGMVQNVSMQKQMG